MSGAEEAQTERWKQKRAWYDSGGTRGLDQTSASAGFDAGWNAAQQPTPSAEACRATHDADGGTLECFLPQGHEGEHFGRFRGGRGTGRWRAAPLSTGPQPKMENDYPVIRWAAGELCYLAADGTGFWKVQAMPPVTR